MTGDAVRAWEDAQERIRESMDCDARPDPDAWEDEAAELDRLAADLRSATTRLEAMEFTSGPLGCRQTAILRSIAARLVAMASDARELSDTYEGE